MSDKRVIALVVTYNRLPHLKRTVARLLQADPAHLAGVLVVNNASTDGTNPWLAEQNDPRLHVLSLPFNSGGAGGFEAGMRHAMARLSPDWLLLMDDDARPAPDMLETFAARDRDSHEGWVAATYFPDGGICEMNRPVLNPFLSLKTFLVSLVKGRAGYHVTDAAYMAPRPTEVDGASFVGFFVARSAVERAGYPDGRLFIYGDDALYSIHLRRQGVRIGFDPGLRFEHDCGTEMGAHPIKPLWKVYYMYRNQLLVYRAAAGPVLFWPVLVLKALSWRRKARHYGTQQGIYLKLLRRALRDGRVGQRDVSFDQVRNWAETDSNS